MKCMHLDNLSNDWVKEKIECISPGGKKLIKEIQDLFRSNIKNNQQYFTPQEFTRFLTFKGLARSNLGFLKNYATNNKVQSTTQSIFTSQLKNYLFIDALNGIKENQILNEISTLFKTLDGLNFVGPAVASACLALCFPDLCATADYIVPSMIYNQYDDENNMNPLFYNQLTANSLRNNLSLPFAAKLSPKDARKLVFNNYLGYVKDMWRIKQAFRLDDYSIQDIEVGIWSFGLCYCHKKLKGRNNKGALTYHDDRPISYSLTPSPPRKGPFVKQCPN